jgi:MFS family permease
VAGADSGALALSVLAWRPIRRPSAQAATASAAHQHRPLHALGAWPLVASYGLAGLGYIITATYLPLLIHGALHDVNPLHIWAMFGLAAVPSCFLWHSVHERLGTRRAMQWNLVVQAVGVALPAINHSAAAYLASAVLVGGTFVGTVTIAVPAARHAAHLVRFNLVAAMTAAYGVGQIAGPLMASALMSHGGSFNGAMEIASAALLIAAGICEIRRLARPARPTRPIRKLDTPTGESAMNTTSRSPRQNLLARLNLSTPIIQAPMAGVSTPAMAAAVSEARPGLAGVGAMNVDGARKAIRETRALTSKPFNINLFCHVPDAPMRRASAPGSNTSRRNSRSSAPPRLPA